MGGNFLYSRDLYVSLRSGNREKLDAVTRNGGGVKAIWECIAFASSGSE